MDIVDCIIKSDNFANIKQEVQRGVIAKALLLMSKDESYALSFAKVLASLILNNGNEERNENFERVLLESHPDVKIYPQKDKLLVADSEEIVNESFMLPVQSDKKIFIIANFANSMESAQNKLLKVLEEPPKNVYIILTCSNINLVLPTIRSRCNKYELAKVSDKIIEELFANHDNYNIIKCLCDGYIGKAENLANNKNLNFLFESAISVITGLKSSKQVLTYAKNLTDNKEYFNLFIEVISLALEDLIAIKNEKSVRLAFIKERLENVSNDYSIKAICEIQSLLNNAVKEQSYNTNLTLIIENLLLNILEVKYICK